MLMVILQLITFFQSIVLAQPGSTKTRNGTERNGTERNGTNATNGTVVFRRRDEDRTYFCL